MKPNNREILQFYPPLKDFPEAVVDQTNYRISEIIRRNKAGEQVLGNNQLNYDYSSSDQNYDPEKLNPFVDMGFDLDDVIQLANKNGKKVTDLQNRLGEIQALQDTSKTEEQPGQQVQAPVHNDEPAAAAE